jgi:hypothetical protein
MPPNDHVFVTHWRVPGTCDEVYEVLRRAEDLPRWWPSVYLVVKTVVPGGPHGLGGQVDLHTKGWLPYTLRWRSKVIATDHPWGFTLVASGDFDGTGIWRFRQEGAEVAIEFDWRIRADKPLLRRWSWLLRPIFVANHRWAMRQGEASLWLELQRRRASSDAERQHLPPPPGPTFVRRRPDLGTP